MPAQLFKVRRNLLAMRSASIIGGAADIDKGVNTATGSVSTFSGGLTAASTFSATGCAIIGTGGTAIAGFLAGSGVLEFGNLNSGVASFGGITVTGLTQSYKVFISGSDLDPDLSVACVSCSPGGGVLRIGVQNTGSGTYTAASEFFTYIAFLDK